MIENEELGLKVAKDKTEELWIKLRDRAEQTIIQSKAEIEIQETIIKVAEKHISKD